MVWGHQREVSDSTTAPLYKPAMPPIPLDVVHPQPEPKEPDDDSQAGLPGEAITPESELANAGHALSAADGSAGSMAATVDDLPESDANDEQSTFDAAARRRRRPARRPRQPAAQQDQDGPGGALMPLAIFAALAAGSWLLFRLVRRRRGRASAPAGSAPGAPALAGKLSLPAAPPQPPPAAPQPLAGTTFAIADT